MADPQSGLDQTRVALAALTACIVQALAKQRPAFQEDFENALEAAYYQLRNSEASHIGAMETLSWTREFLKDLQSR